MQVKTLFAVHFVIHTIKVDLVRLRAVHAFRKCIHDLRLIEATYL